jgi:hypothetical protein
MKRAKAIATVLLLAVLAMTASGCVFFGYGILTSVEVEAEYVGTWTYAGMYFANISFTVTNTGLLDLDQVHVTFRVTTQSGGTFTDFTIVDAIDAGDTTAGICDIQTDGTPAVEVKVTGTQRFTN